MLGVRRSDDPPLAEESGHGRDVLSAQSPRPRGASRRSTEDGAAHSLRREIHDGLLQLLSGISLRLASVAALIRSDRRKAPAAVEELSQTVSQEQKLLRKWLRRDDRRSIDSAVVDFVPLIDQVCRQAQSQWGLEVALRHSPRVEVPAAIADNAYRIIQEALANAGRHARAAHARVAVRVRGARLHLVVEDDGRGFPFHGNYDLETLMTRRIGPRSLMERVAALNGDVSLDSTTSGSRIQIELPLKLPHVATRQRS